MSAKTSSQIPCLIQLNGENVMANLLPIMALKPERIIQIVTKSQRAERSVAHFKEVFALLSKERGYEGYRPRIQDQTVGSSDMPEVRDAVARLLLENVGAVVNFSGGSKLMSLGAYQAASALGRPSMFCDVEEERFVNGRTGPLPAPPDYEMMASQFSIGLMMAIHGRRREDWRVETPTDALRDFGLKAYELRNQQWGPLEAFNKALRAALFGQTDKLPESTEELSALIARPLTGAIANSDPARQYLAAATAAGLLKSQGADAWKLTAAAKREEIDRVYRLMTTGWLELAVLDRILRLPSYKEVLWNPTSAERLEGGIFCIDSKGMTLRYFECLPNLYRSPQDHLEAVAQRARRLGGGGAEATLVLLKAAHGQDTTLRHAARRLGVEIVLGPEEIVTRFTKGLGQK